MRGGEIKKGGEERRDWEVERVRAGEEEMRGQER